MGSFMFWLTIHWFWAPAPIRGIFDAGSGFHVGWCTVVGEGVWALGYRSMKFSLKLFLIS